jgi:ankyrin repeat protein
VADELDEQTLAFRINDRGQTALAAGVFRRSADVVTALLKAGADPDHGSPSAVETAAFFELPDIAQTPAPAPAQPTQRH